MIDFLNDDTWRLAIPGLLLAALTLAMTSLRARWLPGEAVPSRRRRWTALLVPVVAGFVSFGIAGCGLTGRSASVVTRVVTATATDAPTTEPTSTLRPTRAAPSNTPAGDQATDLVFVISDDHLWQKPVADTYSVWGQEDTFAWSQRAVKGDFEFRADVESDFANYGEAMVVVYGDGEGWTPGCLVFNITGYWQAIRAHSIYDPDVEWLVRNEEQLDLTKGDRFRMTIRIAGEQASLFVDDRLVASTPMLPGLNREGYLALVKYGGSAPVSFANLVLRTGDVGEAVAAVPSKTPAPEAQVNSPTPDLPPTSTLVPTRSPSATPTSAPTATRPPATPTDTRPPPTPEPTSPPTDTPPPPFRPPTGMLEDHSPGGQGQLLIKNGTDADALVVLTGLDDKAVKSAYIRNAESFSMTGIPDGTYRLYYSKGEAFSQETNRFTRNATYQRLDSTIEFTTSATQYTAWEVTLYGVAGGNVGSEQVDPSKFP
jgi:hypothetical protein